MALVDEKRVRDCYALMETARACAEALFLDLNMQPGDVKEVGGYKITYPICGNRHRPFMEPLKGKEAAA